MNAAELILLELDKSSLWTESQMRVAEGARVG
jgi:hypothetical protein